MLPRSSKTSAARKRVTSAIGVGIYRERTRLCGSDSVVSRRGSSDAIKEAMRRRGQEFRVAIGACDSRYGYEIYTVAGEPQTIQPTLRELRVAGRGRRDRLRSPGWDPRGSSVDDPPLWAAISSYLRRRRGGQALACTSIGGTSQAIRTSTSDCRQRCPRPHIIGTVGVLGLLVLSGAAPSFPARGRP
jgi:hypothetical protein